MIDNIKFNKVAIVTKNNNKYVLSLINKLYKQIKKNYKVYLEKYMAKKLSIDYRNYYSFNEIIKICDIALVVGGDGSFLNISRKLSIINNIPIVGINKGKLGFLTDINPKKISEQLFGILKGNFLKEKRMMLEANLSKNIVALNEIVISTENFNKLFQIDIYINKLYAYTQRSNGIIISTPTGSTAHALSAGGSIIHPNTHAIILTPILSHSLSSRPLIIDSNNLIEIKINKKNCNTKSILIFDGNKRIISKNRKTIKIKKYKKDITILHPVDYNYFSMLRSKLYWEKNLCI